MQDLDTVVLRRLAAPPVEDPADAPADRTAPMGSAGPSGIADVFDGPLTTPVPPPLPVLPEPETGGSPASGRRFAATKPPADYVWAAPRRSAASPFSPASPVSAVEAALPQPVGPPTAPPGTRVALPTDRTAAVGRRVASTPKRGKRAKTANGRTKKPAVVVISAVAIFALLLAGVVYVATLGATTPRPQPTTQPTPTPLDPLITAADLGTLGGVDWLDSTASDDSATPLCLTAAAEDEPTAQRSVTRRITAADGGPETVTNLVETYETTAVATTAFAKKMAKIGTCDNVIVLATGASALAGLADQAEVVRFTVQNETNEYHSLALTRTGRTVSVVDVLTVDTEVSGEAVGRAIMPTLSRQCTGSEGTCPSNLLVSSTLLPLGDQAGWLTEVDLPRITPGAGRWGGLDPTNTVDLVGGSQCEAVDLNAGTGATSAAQRTFLLVDDPAAPAEFGLDQAVYTFGTAKQAKKLATKIITNVTDCADRVPTATVTDGPSVKGTAADGAKIQGASFLVEQQTGKATKRYRISVLTVGDQVVYLLANPSATFDFSDSAWRTLSTRAGQRASQRP